jgi:hypothetical protein
MHKYFSSLKYVLSISINAFIGIIVFLILLPFVLIFRQMKSKVVGENETLLLAGVETSNNMRNISAVLAESRIYKVYVHEFIENPLYKEDGFSPWVHNIRFGVWCSSDHFLIRSGKRAIRFIVFLKMLLKIDIFFFNWTVSYLPLNLDYLLIKAARKKLIVRHCGSDVRYRPLQHAIHRSFGVSQWFGAKSSPVDLAIKLYKQCFSELTAIVLSTRDHATFQYYPLVERPYIQMPLPRTVGLSLEKKLILHAPSDPSIKGTSIVIKAIQILETCRKDFEFLLLTGMPHEEVLQALKRTTILIDQPGAVPARLATEGFASGCVVIGGNVLELHGYDDCPSIQFPDHAEKLAQILDKLLSNQEEMETLADLSYSFWLDHFSPEAYNSYFVKVLKGQARMFSRVKNHEIIMINATTVWYEKLAVRLRYGKWFEAI